MKNRKYSIKKNQIEGLSIFKLHYKLVELNINHEFIDRYEGIRKIIEVNNIGTFVPFDYQIIIKENENTISLVQSTFSYGITQNLIEVYNFVDEPIVSDYKYITELIKNKNLNSYIIDVNTLKGRILK